MQAHLISSSYIAGHVASVGILQQFQSLGLLHFEHRECASLVYVCVFATQTLMVHKF